MLLSLTFWLNSLSISDQTIFEVCSPANDCITADYAALDVASGNQTHILIGRLLQSYINKFQCLAVAVCAQGRANVNTSGLLQVGR